MQEKFIEASQYRVVPDKLVDVIIFENHASEGTFNCSFEENIASLHEEKLDSFPEEVSYRRSGTLEPCVEILAMFRGSCFQSFQCFRVTTLNNLISLYLDYS